MDLKSSRARLVRWNEVRATNNIPTPNASEVVIAPTKHRKQYFLSLVSLFLSLSLRDLKVDFET